MKNQRYRRSGLLALMITPFQTSGMSVKKYFCHLKSLFYY